MADREEPDAGVRLGNALLKRGLITSEQLREALMEQAERPGRDFGELLVERGFVTREQIDALPEALANFGKYELLRELGRGGMGVVYEARDRELGRLVALKLLLGRRGPGASSDEERFMREARLAAGLPPHPGIVAVFEAGSVGDRRFIAMERVEGEPFSSWRNGVDLRRQAKVLRDAALALQHAHAHGVIHRDLKPDNILVDAAERPHIMDFGLAKAVGQDVSLSLTAEGMIVGTPAYMSPEQAQGLRSIDGRTDVWSLGVLLYEALTGRQPFQGQTAVEILVKASKHAAPSPSRVVSRAAMASFDPAVEKICLKALAKKPAERYASAEAFAEDIERWLRGEVVRAAPSTIRLRTAAGAPRKSKLVPVVVGITLLVGIGAVALALKAPSPGPPTEKAVETPPNPAWIPLVAKADPKDGTIKGSWRLQDGQLLSESMQGLSVFSLPFEPPPEYDLRVEFTPHGEKPDINLVGVADGRPFQFYVGAQASTWYGFGQIDGDPAFGHPTGTRQSGLMTQGRRHVALLEVRKGRVSGYLDGRKMATLDLGGRTLQCTTGLLPHHRTRLGLVTYNNPTAFHAVEVLIR